MCGAALLDCMPYQGSCEPRKPVGRVAGKFRVRQFLCSFLQQLHGHYNALRLSGPQHYTPVAGCHVWEA
jgi:hypothetical protein